MDSTIANVGDMRRLSGTLRRISDNEAVDPSAVTFQVRNPAGVVTTYTTDNGVTKSATGVYYLDISLTMHGRWWWKIISTGSGQAATADQAIDVTMSVFGGD